MAYDGNKLSLMYGTRDGAFNVWVYRSADAIATVRAAGYISDGTARGMKVRDVVWVLDTNVPTTSICSVLAITSGAADLSDGTAISEINS